MKNQLVKIIENEEWLMTALRDVRGLYLPDWYIAAGAVRNTVWNSLHGRPGVENLKDIDVVYFDASDIEGKVGKEAEAFLKAKNPLPWEVVNQATAHLFNKRKQVYSSSESIAYWSETPTCVGVRMNEDDSLEICAPHGLYDLMNLIVRPIPEPYQNLTLYGHRIEQKQWEKTWPKLKILKK